MRTSRMWLMLLALTGPVLFGVSCTTQVRDAMVVGALDFITGTTADTLSSLISLESAVGGG